MKRLAIFLVFFISISVFSVLSCSNNDEEIFRIVNALIGPEGGSITSSDGKLTLDIPPGALDEDTEITIRKLNKSEIPPESNEIDVDSAYELLPDGLEFLVPVTVSVLLDILPLQEDGTMTTPLLNLFIFSDGVLELLDNLITEVDGDENIVTVSGDFSNFSNILLPIVPIGNPVLSATVMGVPPAVPPGVIFPAIVTVVSSNPADFEIIFIRYLDKSQNSVKPVEEIDPSGGADFAQNLLPIDTGPGQRFQARVEYVCTPAGTGIYGSFLAITGEVALIDSVTVVEIEFVEFKKTVICTTNISAPTPTPVTAPEPTPTPTPKPTPTPTPPSQPTCADISQIDFDAIIESLAGQTNQAPFITPNACDMSRITITNDNNGVVVTDNVPDGGGGGFPTLNGPSISQSPVQDADGTLCDLSAFGRDDIAGGNDVGIQALGQFVVTPQGAILFRFYQVSYGIDTPVQDWFGDPFIVNCEPDP